MPDVDHWTEELAKKVAKEVHKPTGIAKQPNPFLRFLLETKPGQAIVVMVVASFVGGGTLGTLRSLNGETVSPVAADAQHSQDHKELKTDMNIMHRQQNTFGVNQEVTGRL